MYIELNLIDKCCSIVPLKGANAYHNCYINHMVCLLHFSNFRGAFVWGGGAYGGSALITNFTDKILHLNCMGTDSFF